MPTILTDCAALAEKYSAADYRDMYDELRQKMSLDKLVVLLQSAVTKGFWNQYERGLVTTLTRERKNELLAVCDPAHVLPLPAAEAVAAVLDPNATIWQVGKLAATRGILLGKDITGAVTIRLNGTCQVTQPQPQPRRPACFRPRLSLNPRVRIDQCMALVEQAETEILNAGGEP
jgi:hypothetical protein